MEHYIRALLALCVCLGCCRISAHNTQWAWAPGTHILSVFGFVCRILYVYLFVVHAHIPTFKVCISSSALSLSRFYKLFFIQHKIFIVLCTRCLFCTALLPSRSVFRSCFSFFLYFCCCCCGSVLLIWLKINWPTIFLSFFFFSLVAVACWLLFFSCSVFLLCLLSQTTTVLPCISYNSCSLLTSPSFSCLWHRVSVYFAALCFFVCV